jgi:urea transport system ATP-binding protein
MATALLEVKNLSVEFSGFKAINNVNLKIEEGEVRVLIGPNGAGKSTIADLITGKTKPTAGSVFFKGVDITGKSPDEIAGKYKIGRKFQGPNVFDNMTVYRNIEIALSGYTTVWKSLFYRRTTEIKKKIKALLEQIRLYEIRDVMATELSHGQRQWLEIGMVIAQNPSLIILDEPTAGMTAEETFKTGEMIKELLGEHTVIVVEHDMDFVRQIAQTVTVLHQGRVLAEGTFEEIEKDPQVIQVYLKDD